MRCRLGVFVAIVAIVVMTIGVGCSSGGRNVEVYDAGLTSQSDSLSYIIGLNIASQLEKMDSTINVGVVCRAIVNHFDGVAVMDDEQARSNYLRYLLFVEPERRRGYEDKFLADLAINNRDFTRTKTGLTYSIDVIGDESLVPRGNNDWLELKYTVSRVGGETLYPVQSDTTEVVKATMEGSLDDFVKGVEESVRLIGKGGKIRAWIPSKLAYGEDGNEQIGVEPIETLFYDIELVNVERNAATKRRKELEEDSF